MKTRLRMTSSSERPDQKGRADLESNSGGPNRGRHCRQRTFVLPAQQTGPPAAPPAPVPAGNPASPGESAPPAKTSTIRTTVELVNVPVTALTRHGQRVIDLSVDEVKVFEDDVEQKITHFERETRTPLRIGSDPRHQQFRAQPIIV